MQPYGLPEFERVRASSKFFACSTLKIPLILRLIVPPKDARFCGKGGDPPARLRAGTCGGEKETACEGDGEHVKGVGGEEEEEEEKRAMWCAA